MCCCHRRLPEAERSQTDPPQQHWLLELGVLRQTDFVCHNLEMPSVLRGDAKKSGSTKMEQETRTG